MIFIPKIKPNIKCVILGHDLETERFCWVPHCKNCGKDVYELETDYPSIELLEWLYLPRRIFCRVRHYWREWKLEYVKDEIPF